MMRVFARAALMLTGLLAASMPASAEVRSCTTAEVGARVLWAAADVDGDRVVDFVRVSTAPSGRGRVDVVRLPCPRTARPLLGVTGAGTLAARDVDDDRDIDLVQLDAAGTPVRAWLNDGHGRFSPVSPDTADLPPPSGWGLVSSDTVTVGVSPVRQRGGAGLGAGLAITALAVCRRVSPRDHPGDFGSPVNTSRPARAPPARVSAHI